jgi:hypothetical protein
MRSKRKERGMRGLLATAVLTVACVGMAASWLSVARSPTTIDCPPRASIDLAGIITIGPRGSDVSARVTPSLVWRLDAVITDISLGGRTLEMDGVTLHIDSHSVILVDCRRAPMRDLREGSSAAVLYEERTGRNVVIVIEGQSDDR